MKRLLTIGLMLATALAFTNCSEQLVTPEKDQIDVNGNIEDNTIQGELTSIPYEVYVNEPETKTIASGGNTYWVDEATALANGLDKDAVDRVTIYTLDKYQESTEQEPEFLFTCHGKYTYAGKRKFVGDLTLSEGEIENWYCLYPYVSSAAGAGKEKVEETFIFGASAENDYTQVQLNANSTNHIAGKNYPMFGKVEGAGKTNPTFTMSHLSALVALKLVNADGDEPILISSAAVSVPQITSGNDKQSEVKIVGEFKVDLTGELPEFVALENTSNKAILELGQNFAILPGKDVTLYLAVCPFDASGKTLEISLNGDSKMVKMGENVKFEAGKITTLTIPLSLEHTVYTDGSEFLGTMVNCTIGQSAVINGKSIDDMIIIGSKNKSGSITITGALTDVLDALPLGFFAASWNDNQAVLIIEELQAYIDILGEPLGTTLKREDLAGMLNKDISYFSLKPYPAGIFSDNPYVKHNLLILYEEPFHKGVTAEKADSQFLDGYGLTVAGIRRAIIDGDNSQGDQTKLVDLLEENSSQIRSVKDKLGFLITDAVICSALKYADCTVKLRTANIGEEGATDPRVALWGLDIKGDN